MKKAIIMLVSALMLPALAAGKEPAKPISADAVQVLKIASQDGRAVVRTPAGKTLVIKPGDVFGTNGTVLEIAADKVVFEEKQGKEKETVIIRLTGGKQTVERIRKTADRKPMMLAPGK